MTTRVFFRKVWRRLLFSSSFFIEDKTYLRLLFRYFQGYSLNLENPQTFCEKLQILKLRSKNHPEFTQMVDKVDAKKFVASIVGEEYIIPTLGIWNKFDEIDFSKLKGDYILKCAHDSSKGVVIRDGQLFDKTALKKRMEHFQHCDYFLKKREYPYKNVPHRILAERFLVNGTDAELRDYKFFCFGGRAEYCQVIADRSSKETIDFYDRNWNHQPFFGLNPIAQNAPIAQSAPNNYHKMCEIADRIATAINWPFVRIDLYNVNGNIYFGEITFFPMSGFGRFTPNEWNLKFGEMIKL